MLLKTRSLRRYVALLAALLVSVLISGVPSMSATGSSEAVSTRVNASLATLQRFEGSRRVNDVASLASLQSAINQMMEALNTHELTVGNFVAERRTIVIGWVDILKAIENSYDPTYNPNDIRDVPKTCVAPPDGFLCGADPSVIKNASARAAYVAALKQNDLNQQRALYYSQLSALDGQAMAVLKSDLRLFNKIAPEGVGPDFTALDQIVQLAGISGARRSAIDAMIYEGSTTH